MATFKRGGSFSTSNLEKMTIDQIAAKRKSISRKNSDEKAFTSAMTLGTYPLAKYVGEGVVSAASRMDKSSRQMINSASSRAHTLKKGLINKGRSIARTYETKTFMGEINSEKLKTISQSCVSFAKLCDSIPKICVKEGSCMEKMRAMASDIKDITEFVQTKNKDSWIAMMPLVDIGLADVDFLFRLELLTKRLQTDLTKEPTVFDSSVYKDVYYVAEKYGRENPKYDTKLIPEDIKKKVSDEFSPNAEKAVEDADRDLKDLVNKQQTRQAGVEKYMKEKENAYKQLTKFNIQVSEIKGNIIKNEELVKKSVKELSDKIVLTEGSYISKPIKLKPQDEQGVKELLTNQRKSYAEDKTYNIEDDSYMKKLTEQINSFNGNNKNVAKLLNYLKKIKNEIIPKLKELNMNIIKLEKEGRQLKTVLATKESKVTAAKAAYDLILSEYDSVDSREDEHKRATVKAAKDRDEAKKENEIYNTDETKAKLVAAENYVTLIATKMTPKDLENKELERAREKLKFAQADLAKAKGTEVKKKSSGGAEQTRTIPTLVNINNYVKEAAISAAKSVAELKTLKTLKTLPEEKQEEKLTQIIREAEAAVQAAEDLNEQLGYVTIPDGDEERTRTLNDFIGTIKAYVEATKVSLEEIKKYKQSKDDKELSTALQKAEDAVQKIKAAQIKDDANLARYLQKAEGAENNFGEEVNDSDEEEEAAAGTEAAKAAAAAEAAKAGLGADAEAAAKAKASEADAADAPAKAAEADAAAKKGAKAEPSAIIEAYGPKMFELMKTGVKETEESFNEQYRTQFINGPYKAYQSYKTKQNISEAELNKLITENSSVKSGTDDSNSGSSSGSSSSSWNEEESKNYLEQLKSKSEIEVTSKKNSTITFLLRKRNNGTKKVYEIEVKGGAPSGSNAGTQTGNRNGNRNLTLRRKGPNNENSLEEEDSEETGAVTKKKTNPSNLEETPGAGASSAAAGQGSAASQGAKPASSAASQGAEVASPGEEGAAVAKGAKPASPGATL